MWSSSEMARPAPAGTTMAPDILLRGVAICMVVFNHAAETVRPMEFGGGLNIMLLLSGFTFAQFVLSQGRAEGLRRGIRRLAFGIWLPCLAIVLLSFAVKREWSWTELLFVSNLHSVEHIAILYSWYPEVILQLLGIIYLASFLPGATEALHRRPMATSLFMLALSFMAFLLIPNAPFEADAARMVYGVAWNFILGVTVFFALSSRPGLSNRDRLAVLALAATLGLVAFGLGDDWLRTVCLVAAVWAMLFVKRVRVPSGLRLNLLSQAAFTIFLWHPFFLRLFNAAGLRRSPTSFDLRDVLLAATTSIVGGLVIWINWTALRRAWHFMLVDAAEAPRRVELSAVGRPGTGLTSWRSAARE